MHLGRRQDGVEVNDVSLPPWAHSSPRELARQLRAALESPVCSEMLHSWIDLIFGYKQRGDAAEAADNVYCPQTYEGRFNLEGLPPHERRALELQVGEFGQCPAQLFRAPHPRRAPGAAAGPTLDAAQLKARLQQLEADAARAGNPWGGDGDDGDDGDERHSPP